MDDIFKMVHKFSVKVQEEMENAVIGQIVSIAKENGMYEEITLNKKAITAILVKSQKQKVNVTLDSYPYCPQCGRGEKLNLLSFYKPPYCPDCGQALDWEG